MMADYNVGFFGGTIPKEVVSMARHLKDLDKQLFSQILKVVVNALEEKECSVSMAEIIEDNSLSEEKLSDIVSGMYELLKEALRLPSSSVIQESFEEDLRELRRPALDASVTQHGPRLPKLEKFRWRVDVAISTSSLSRALQPTILMQLKLSDGNLHQFEVSVPKFQELRYNVSLILKEMNDLEKRSVLKIQDYHVN
ncbi:COMM domain-containing protein 5 isoform X3 [Pangasianodon hypophthalmus]|uniref:COMM domain-containing protein 5 isoform X3 n=1 Tax=Pangasianodon hypophthalmus TaxID=310915 RepID=UPI00147C5407|nr:COMM domain-containing protein 5 isoform X3 [Pangasianodon hypophthalmus]